MYPFTQDLYLRIYTPKSFVSFIFFSISFPSDFFFLIPLFSNPIVKIESIFRTTQYESNEVIFPQKNGKKIFFCTPLHVHRWEERKGLFLNILSFEIIYPWKKKKWSFFLYYRFSSRPASYCELMFSDRYVQIYILSCTIWIWVSFVRNKNGFEYDDKKKKKKVKLTEIN